ncbi:DUF202 domain-containing protein [Glutamicibacter creatinolyticus]|uniref:DUF202 domain-containing protein n=1 Tax=Glutamicibacter creatinolyticus TaxID=162496 RepID=UPI0032162288
MKDVRISDPGLQPERTVLAWGRTLISFLVVSAVFLRWLPHDGQSLLVLVGIAALVSGGIFLSQRRRYRRMAQGLEAGRVQADAVAVFATAAATLALGATALVLLLGPLLR